MTDPVAVWRRGREGWERRWRDLPLRTRLTTAAALSAALAITAVVAVAYIAVRHELFVQVDNQLRKQATEVRPQASAPFHYAIETGVGEINGFAQVVAADGTRAQNSAPLPVGAGDLRVARTGQGSVRRDLYFQGLHVRMITVPLDGFRGYALQIALPLTNVDHQLHRLAFMFVIVAAGGVALTGIASWGAVRRVTRPVRALTEATEQIAATRDLTLRIAAQGGDELGRLAATFNQMLDELERSVGAQRQLVMDASHELRTPLASLRTNVEVLNDVERLSPDQRRAVLDGIVTQLDELTGLVADVVELARGEAPPTQHESVALDELVVRAVERAQRHWPAIRFDVEVEPVTVRGVPSRLDRAVANMLDNAGKFSPDGAAVDVALTADGELSVADRGPGVPEEALPHVFDRFYRADEARAMPGSGLGLAIAQQVAEGHGASIRLANRPGGGAVATLALPVGDAAVPADPTELAPELARRPEPPVPVPVEESLFR